MKLTEKQKRFADEYIISGNAEDAARKAGYSARGNTTKLLQNTTIKNYIAERMAQLEDEKIAKQDEILKYLTRVMRREEDEHSVIVIKTSRSEYVPDEKGVMRKQTVETEEAQVVPIPTKVSDANKAAELLGKRYAMWTEKQSVEHSGAVSIDLSYLSDEELDKALKKYDDS